ncbi:hypothetical protein [Bounagaea algeriensis]
MWHYVAGKVVAAWRARAAVQAPSHLRELGGQARWTLLAALLVLRQQEITDNLVELLMSTVHTIGARADRRVTEEMVSSFKRVRNKQHMLHRVAEAAHAPIIDGIELVRRYADSAAQTYGRGKQVPIRGVVGGDWLELLYRGEVASSRVQRSVYELCLFTALREQVRCKEIWVEGADKWRTPETDLPADFEVRAPR